MITMNYLRQFLVISVLFIGNSSFAQATPTETRLVVDQRPLTITLRKDHEHRLHFPEPVMIEVPDDLLTSAKVLQADGQVDRKSTRLNSSHVKMSYAVFC